MPRTPLTWSTNIWLPPTPFEGRMEQLGRMFPPPPSHPAHGLLFARARILAERDLSFRLWTQELKSKVPNFILTRMEGGSQFPVANLLRHYFQEYASRIVAHGPHSFPTSFNVIESFLRYSHDYFMFDLREEKEHLLRLRDYIDWYTSGSIPDEPEILLEVVKEGLIYSYHMVEPVEDFRVETKDAELVVSGVALVRHSTELSMIILCGERPGDITDEVISRFDEARPVMGKEGLKVDPSYSVDDRFLKEIPGYSRIIGLVRFDLTSRKFFVRYLNHDLGKSYRVATDDPTIFTNDITETERKKTLKASFDILVSYEPLFGLLVSAMYLPVFFLDQTDRVAHTKFSTELQARRASTEVRKAIRQLGSIISQSISPGPYLVSRTPHLSLWKTTGRSFLPPSSSRRVGSGNHWRQGRSVRMKTAIQSWERRGWKERKRGQAIASRVSWCGNMRSGFKALIRVMCT